MERSEKIKLLAYHYGKTHQLQKAFEEIGELIVAICKYADCREDEKAALKDDIIGEIADVCVLMEQLKLFYGPKEVEDRIDFKIDRQIERICMGRD